MPALAEPLSTRHPSECARPSAKPVCAICLDQMVAAEASAFLADDEISYLWCCDTCGYGFVTRHPASSN